MLTCVSSRTRSHDVLGAYGEGNSLLRKRGSYNAAGQVLHSLLLSGMNPSATKDIEPRMSPTHQHRYQILRDFALRTQHLEDLVTEYLFQPIRLKMRRNPEHAIAIETAA